MNYSTLYATSILASLMALPASALATDKPTASITLNAENHDFSDQRGSLRTISLEYSRDLGATAIMVAPTFAQQRLGGNMNRAAGGKAALDLQLGAGLTSQTTVGAAENAGIVPYLELGQDFGVKVMVATVANFGARYARYQGEDVTFAHLGLRRYFKGGSVAYRLTRTMPEHGGAFFAHLANLSLSDARGTGRTQLWLGYGASADNRLPSGQSLSGKDWSATLRRVQPLGSRFSLAPLAGYASYALPGRRVSSVSLGIGLSLAMD